MINLHIKLTILFPSVSELSKMYSVVQVFVLELYSGDSAIPRYNLSADSPYFFLQDLEPDVLFRAVVFAVNSKGRSPGIVLEELTFRDPEKRTSKTVDSVLECDFEPI